MPECEYCFYLYGTQEQYDAHLDGVHRSEPGGAIIPSTMVDKTPPSFIEDEIPAIYESSTEDDIVNLDPEEIGTVTKNLMPGQYVLLWECSMKGSHHNRKVGLQILQDGEVLREFKYKIDDWFPLSGRIFFSIETNSAPVFSVKAFCDQQNSSLKVRDVYVEIRKAKSNG